VKLPLSLIAIGTVLALTACSKSAPPADTTPPDATDGPEPSATPIVLPTAAKKFTVTSTAFADGKPIPAKYTCQDASQLPPLSWSGDLAGGKFVAIVIDDADAPNGGYVQWFVADMPVKPPATLDPDQLPDGAHAASNSDGDPGWTAPCPDPGATHHYRFTVYSLDGPSGVSDGADPAEALQTLAPHIKAEGQLTGTVTGK
jgi:Raf kinase inhibitor-like YbhB/YbcL family protein